MRRIQMQTQTLRRYGCKRCASMHVRGEKVQWRGMWASIRRWQGVRRIWVQTHPLLCDGWLSHGLGSMYGVPCFPSRVAAVGCCLLA